MKKITALILTAFWLTAIAKPQPIIETFLDSDLLEGAFVGIIVKDLASDSVVYAVNEQDRFTPASNLKLFTSAAALELLGANYRFTTSFYTNDIDYREGTLDGDLFIVGGGDPLISGRFQDSLTVVLQHWANSLIDLGIEKINGDIVVDNNFFEPDEIGPGWSYDYLSYWYACPISALSFNDNCVDFHAYPVRNLGDACQIVFSPPTDYIAITNNSVTLPAGVDNTFDYVRQVGTNNVEFFGGIAVDDTSGLIDYVTVDKPDIYCAQIFRNVLKLNNIKVKGEIVEIGRDSLPEKYQYRNLVKLFDWQSEPMSVVIKVINKNSQNFFAEEALKTIGAEYVAEGSFPMSTRIVRDWLEAIGISRDEVSYYDGSGLSHMNLATPFSIIQLLQYMYESDDFETYYESMAIPGVDRSVRGRMAAEPMASLMRTKTGSIANTRTFSGYLTTSSGRLMAFSMMINNYAATRDEIDDWTDGFCSYIINTR